jgi:hypothetical protein
MVKRLIFLRRPRVSNIVIPAPSNPSMLLSARRDTI